MIAFSRVHNKNLNVSDCKNILKDVFNQIRVITVDKIQNVVSNYFNINLVKCFHKEGLGHWLDLGK